MERVSPVLLLLVGVACVLSGATGVMRLLDAGRPGDPGDVALAVGLVFGLVLVASGVRGLVRARR